MLADGRLTAEAIMDATISAGLLTLSGCVTGLSERRPGEELVGLVRAAATAGIPSVVASLWDVDDESASLFFQRFYHFLSAGQRKDCALRNTQEYLLTHAKFSHPMHWAPFVLLGDWQ
jgi:CHAT domain-containing protein